MDGVSAASVDSLRSHPRFAGPLLPSSRRYPIVHSWPHARQRTSSEQPAGASGTSRDETSANLPYT